MSAWGKRYECPGKGVLEHGYSHSGGSFVIRNFRKVGCYKLLYNSGLLCYSRSDSSWRVLLRSSAGMRVWPGGQRGPAPWLYAAPPPDATDPVAAAGWEGRGCGCVCVWGV